MRMKMILVAAMAAALAACATPPAPTVDASLPQAGPGLSLPDRRATLDLIAFGSCNTAEKPIPILQNVALERADLFVYTGDNVYGDAKAGDMNLPELRQQYEMLAQSPDFQALRAASPMLATWDDHDYGLNDAGADFPGRALSKTMFETFWGTAARTGDRDGIYDSFLFGREGRRVQIILLDTRSGRSALSRLPERGPMGPYQPSTDPDQRMLSEAQWTWLERELAKPADIRFVVSSIQVLADGHDFEAWETMPLEQARLYRTIGESGAKGVVFVSGDRHSAGLYRQDGLVGYPLYELTSSSLNLSFREESDEMSTNQLGPMYAPVNYGVVAIDWEQRALVLQIKGETGVAVRVRRVAFDEIGVG